MKLNNEYFLWDSAPCVDSAADERMPESSALLASSLSRIASMSSSAIYL